MIQRMALGIALLSSLTAFADSNVNLNIGSGGAADLLNNTKIMNGEVEQPPAEHVKVNAVCTAQSGKRLHPGDPGYEACITRASSQQPAPKQSPGNLPPVNFNPSVKP